MTGSQLQNSAKALDESLDGAISSLIKAGDFSGKASESTVIHIPGASGKRIVLVGTDGADTAQQHIKVIKAGAAALLRTPSILGRMRTISLLTMALILASSTAD
ncbi:hypothetical protein N9537_04615 [Porticoccaceae bacterium]|nr:hypothetical protein [Porticoccaceae bacterium]